MSYHYFNSFSLVVIGCGYLQVDLRVDPATLANTKLNDVAYLRISSIKSVIMNSIEETVLN
ncbi:MAG: hypothetical protein ACJAQ6_001341 [Arenicella sp.]|jgi:hypothetical protein